MTLFAFLIQRDSDKGPFAVIWTNREMAEGCKDRVSEIHEVTFVEAEE
jgi:hypothetical protein